MSDNRPIPAQLRDAAKRLSWEQIDALARRLEPFADVLNDMLLHPPHPGWADISAVIVMDKYARALRLALNRTSPDREVIANDAVAMLAWWHIITNGQIAVKQRQRAAAEAQAAAA